MPPSENISWFADITLKDRPRVGGKGGSLGELER
jgi:phosphoenolpyruvate synthase/pyruvate phosphate dikinase